MRNNLPHIINNIKNANNSVVKNKKEHKEGYSNNQEDIGEGDTYLGKYDKYLQNYFC